MGEAPDRALLAPDLLGAVSAVTRPTRMGGCSIGWCLEVSRAAKTDINQEARTRRGRRRRVRQHAAPRGGLSCCDRQPRRDSAQFHARAERLPNRNAPQHPEGPSTTVPERVLANVLMNTEHLVSRDDRAALHALIRDASVPAAVKTLATILNRVTHTPPEADKAALRHLCPPVVMGRRGGR